MAETVFALATARGKAGVAVVRISGPAAPDGLLALGVALPPPRHAALRVLQCDGDVLDEAIVLYFPKGQSFTGEDVVELQMHGSAAVLSAVVKALGRVEGLRPALAGEFTRRALENGRMDLSQVEALADLIDAETEAQRRQAQRVLSGALLERTELWRRDLIRALALIEASIDFADEDVPVDVTPEVGTILDSLLAAFRKELAGARVAERVRDGFEVAIIGAPNSGKSSLLNALVGRDVAITSSVAGTTRDIIEVRMDLDGLPVTLLDTAGLRETQDEVEQVGVERARRRAERADVRLWLVAPEDPTPDCVVGPADMIVGSKADLQPRVGAISSHTGLGLDLLLAEISARLGTMAANPGVLIRERQRHALSSATAALESAQRWLYDGGVQAELISADVRSAIQALEMLVGRIGVETVLGEIFASFCIGK